MGNDAQTGISLHLQCGIPIVEFQGEWDETKPFLLTETVERLNRAGHLEIIIDLTQAQRLAAGARDCFAFLEQIAGVLHSRRGRLGAVLTREQAKLAGRHPRTFVHWATSEEQAICFFKGLPMTSIGAKIPARLHPV